jgi:tetratricopeptide (TPR) repeat protein
MKRAISLLLLMAALPASAAELQVTPPRAHFVLQQGELPLLPREGLPLVSESDALQKWLPLLADQKTAEVLAAVKERYGDLTTELEAGDPKGEAAQRAVDGNLSVAGRTPGGGAAVSATMFYFIGSAYLAAQNNQAAEAAFNAALKAMPDYARVHESLGIAYLLAERPADALPHLSRAAQLGLTTPNLYAALGFANQKLGNAFGAASAYQAAMMLEPGNEQWQQGLLSSLAATKQHEAGLALVDQLLKTRPNDAGLWVYRAWLELDAGHKQQGLNSLEVAIRLGNDELANLQVCAALHLELGNVDRAVALLGAGIAKGLDFRYADQSMQSLAAREQWPALQKLVDEYKNVSGLDDTQQSRLLLRRASLSEHNKDVAQETAQLQQALALDPGNAEALLQLGQLQQKAKNYAQAELLLQRASAYATVFEPATLTLAQVAIDQRNYDKALKLLRDVHAANPARTDLARNIEALESLVQLQR